MSCIPQLDVILPPADPLPFPDPPAHKRRTPPRRAPPPALSPPIRNLPSTPASPPPRPTITWIYPLSTPVSHPNLLAARLARRSALLTGIGTPTRTRINIFRELPVTRRRKANTIMGTRGRSRLVNHNHRGRPRPNRRRKPRRLKPRSRPMVPP